MTLQSSGAISINNINIELGNASGTTRSLGDASSRNLAGVPSGAISLSNFYGKSNVQEVIFDNSGGALGNWQNQNLWNTLVSSGIAITSSSVKIILRNITITSSAISTAALETGSGWPAGTNLEVVIESTSQIVGRGGTGGAGAPATFNGVASPGGAGGRALTITSAISGGSIKITNQGAIRGGGGGGGGGGRGSNTTGGKDKVVTYFAGGTGGTGYGSTGTAGAVAAATAGGTVPNAFGGAGGAGGAAGTVGNAGAAGTGTSSSAGAAGGAAGPAIINSALATIVNTGTISGSLS